MTAVLSNALSHAAQWLAQAAAPLTEPATRAATQPTSGPVEPSTAVTHLLVVLLSLGIVAMAAWLVPIFARPSRLSLTNTPGRPGDLNVVHLLIVLAVYMVAVAGAGAILRHMGFVLQPDPDPRATVVTQIIGQVATIAAALIVGAIAFRGGITGMGLSLRHWLHDTLRACSGFLVSLPLVLGLNLVCTWAAIALNLPTQKHPFLVSLSSLEMPWKIAIIVSAAVLTPIGEELLFRGLLQTLLRKYLRSPWAAVVLASVVFAAVHIPAEPQAVPALAMLAVALGYLYERTGRLVAPILMHAIFNAVMLANELSG